MRIDRTFWLCWLMLFGWTGLVAAQGSAAPQRSREDQLLDRAGGLFIAGQADEAIKLASQAIQLNTNHLRSWFMRGRFYQETDQPAKAVADFQQVVRINPENKAVWQQLGTEYFKLGDHSNSLAAFDRFIQMVPREGPRHWARGVVAFEDGQYDKAMAQFQQYRQLDTNDVEVTVWMFLCVAKTKGLERARMSLLPVDTDPRIPMKEIHAMFAGKTDPDEVLRVASINTGPPGTGAEQLNQQLFHAHLYVGLYYEAYGKLDQALEHLGQAAMIYRVKDFLGVFARVHAAALRHRLETASASAGARVSRQSASDKSAAVSYR